MMITLFADASFCPKTGAAGWGSWAIRDGWPKGKFNGGPLRREVPSSTTAEICALAAALWQHDKDGDLNDVKVFMLQSDNTAALRAVRGRIERSGWSASRDDRDVQAIGPTKHRSRAAIEIQALNAINDIVGSRFVWLRHVKGHSSGTTRAWVNEQCDREARRHMQARRIELEAAA